MKNNSILISIIVLLTIISCKKPAQQIDTTYPTIDVTASASFPKQCSVIKRGESFTFRAALSDNVALGSLSVDIHHNFDQHTHSTEVETCNMDAKKTPVKPFVFIRSFSIPEGAKNYDMKENIVIPADVDPGDYHFMIRLTDREGWQTIRGLSIKII